jgi:hypothetical protein
VHVPRGIEAADAPRGAVAAAISAFGVHTEATLQAVA